MLSTSFLSAKKSFTGPRRLTSRRGAHSLCSLFVVPRPRGYTSDFVRLSPRWDDRLERPVLSRSLNVHGVHESLIEDTEVRLLLIGLVHCYGFDPRNYEPAPLKRRAWNFMHREALLTVSGLRERILHDAPGLERLLVSLSAGVSPMFTYPAFYQAFRKAIVLILRTYPSIDIWLRAWCNQRGGVWYGDCSARERTVSAARLYASDLSAAVYRTAKEGRFPLSGMPDQTANYRQAGGASSRGYYTIDRDQAVIRPSEHRLQRG